MTTAPITTARISRPLGEIEFCAWIAQATPGDRLEYHCGFLVLDTFPTFSHLQDTQRTELAKLASRAFWAAEQGLVHLVQERIDTDRFAYIAVVRPKPRGAAASLSALLLEEKVA